MIQKRERVDMFDIAKGIGILLVVAGHIFENRTFQVLVYAFHMPLFLLISGMLMDLTKSPEKSYRKLLVSKFKSLIVPYLIAELLCVILYYFIGGYGPGDLKWIIIDSVLLYSPKGQAIWFLLGLFIAEMIYYLLVKCIRNKFAVIAICAAGYIVSLTVPVPNHHLWLVVRSLHMMFFIMLGHQFAHIIKKKRNLVINIVLFAIFLPCALFNGKAEMVGLNCGNAILYTLSSVTGSVLLITLSDYISHSKNKVVAYIKKHLVLWGQETVIVLCAHLAIMRYIVDKILEAGPHYAFVPASIIFLVVMLLQLGMVIAKRKLKGLRKKALVH